MGKPPRRPDKTIPAVVIECGGSAGEAIDHILSTKIISKIKGLHDNKFEDLENLSELLYDDNWSRFDSGWNPTKSIKAVQDELDRHDQD